MKKPPFDPGDPGLTPFVGFEFGTVFLPNSLYECAAIVVQRSAEQILTVLEELVVRGPINGKFGILPQATWFGVLQRFFTNQSPETTDDASYETFCLSALQIMIKRPHQAAWPTLRTFLIENIDVLSGWAGSFQRERAERRQVFRGEDGNYYFENENLGRCQVLGGKTTHESRIDYITNQLAASNGFLHQFLALFSLFSIADDFNSSPSTYHRLIKATVSTSQYSSIGCEWTFMHFDQSRTYRWRPNSNLCDPNWLAGDVLGILTDTLETDFWLRPETTSEADRMWLEDGCLYQMDYVLDTTLHIGDEPYTYVVYEGKRIRWINGTPERDATVSITVKSLRNHTAEDEQLNRFLSLLVWVHGQHARIKWGVGGGRTAYSKAYSARKSTGMKVNPTLLHRTSKTSFTLDQKLALGLYREAQNSASTFYEFLSYYKILELGVPNIGKRVRAEWLNKVALPRIGHLDRTKEILSTHASLEEYLRKTKVNGIKHAINKTIDSDDPLDQVATKRDNELMREIAMIVMKKELEL